MSTSGYGSDDEIAEATGAAYELTDADVGTSVRVRVTFTDDRGHEETLESEPVAADGSPPAVTADVNGDRTIDADDALVMYYAYRFSSDLGDGEGGGFEEYRQAYLRGLSGASDPTDADLKAMLRAIRTRCAAPCDDALARGCDPALPGRLGASECLDEVDGDPSTHAETIHRYRPAHLGLGEKEKCR